MSLKIEARPLAEVAVIAPQVFRDERGFFVEAFRADQFRDLGLPWEFVQDNHSGSRKNVLRGLHFQWEPPMGKLMRVTRGTAFLVAVDVRRGSPTVGRHFGLEVSAESRLQVWAPAGFARGFCALTDDVEVQYKCTGIYNGKAESAVRWNDSDLAIPWPIRDPIVSEKDRYARTFADWIASPEAAFLAFGSKAATA